MMRETPGSHVKAVAGIGVFFSSNGLLYASLLPWYPLLIERLDLSPWEFGLVVACFAAGAVASSILPARLIARFGSVSVTVVGTVGTAFFAALAGWSTTPWMLAGCLFLLGACDATVDAAQNVAGTLVQDRGGRTILSSMHAVWSLGGLLGGAASTAVAAAGLELRAHLAVVAVVCVGLVLLGARLVGGEAADPPSPRTVLGIDDLGESSADAATADAGQSSARRSFLRAVVPLAVIAVCGIMVEDIANNWSGLAAVQLSGIPVSGAGIAFSVAIGAQCLGRFSGDLLSNRFGADRIAGAGGILIALGGAAIISAVHPAQLLVGLAAMGCGSATLVPGALGAAAHLPGVDRAAGVTLVNWVMRLGFLGTSPLVGLIAAGGGLRWGLSLIVVIGLVTVVFARHLKR